MIAYHVDDYWQADLVEVIKDSRKNKGFKYLLTCIDVFSKYAWVVPLKNKNGETLVLAFKQIIMERKPKNLQTDEGKEFYNSKVKDLLKSHGINHFSTYSELKASVVERFNRTIKEKIEKIFNSNQNRNWIDILPNVVSNYNNSYHRSIKMTPIEASKVDNRDTVWHNLFGKKEFISKPVFKIGDIVRIKKYKALFVKGYKQNYSNELFTVSKVVCDLSGLHYYQLQDINKEDVLGTFYAEELSRFIPPDNFEG